VGRIAQVASGCDLFPRILVLGPPASIAYSFGVQLQKTLPYIGFLVCNEAEAEVPASASDLLPPGALAQQPTSNSARDRVLSVLPSH